MKSTVEPAGIEMGSINCMEIRGGSGPTSDYFPRPGLNIWLSSQSGTCTATGGSDLYLVSSCASGRITRILLADVCSYGSEFTATAGDLQAMMKKYINTIRQTRFVREINEQLELCSQHACFVTMVLSTYFAPTRTLTLCNVGHAPPLLFRARTRTWSALKQFPDNTALKDTTISVVDRNEYQEFSVKLEVGDLVVSYSSALTECRDENGQTLGSEGVLSRVRQLGAARPSEIQKSLADGIRLEHDDNLVGEDATIILCRATSNGIPWIDSLLAPFRYFGRVTDKTKIVPSA